MEEKRIACKKCRRPTLIKDFALAGIQAKTGEPHRRPICKFCLNTKRDERKEDNRFLFKMRRTTYDHSDKYNKKNDTNFSPEEFKRKFHWPSYLEMARIAKLAFEVGCPICPEPKNVYLDYNDMTLDVKDISREPFWYNMGFMCRTKNSQKGTMSLEAFEADNAEWRDWLTWQNRREHTQYGMLLDDQYCLV